MTDNNTMAAKIRNSFDDESVLRVLHKHQRKLAYEKIGQCIKEMRLKNEVKVVDVAAKVGVKYQYIIAIEKGERKPTKELLDKIIAACQPSKK